MSTKEITVLRDDQVLINKRITVKPIPHRSTVFDKEIAISPGAVVSIDLPMDPARRARHPVFKDEDEQEYFEKKLNLPKNSLSVFDRNNKYWDEYRVTITDAGLALNLTNVSDLLQYKVLKVNSHLIAPSWNERNDDPRFRAAFVEEGYENVEINKVQDKKTKAYVFFSRISGSVDSMIDVLNIMGKQINRNSGASIDFLKARLYEIIEDSVAPPGEPSPLDRFLEIAEDEDYEFKVLIDKALNAKAIFRADKNGYRLPKGDEPIADDTKEMIDWLKNPKNQIKFETIKAQIETYFK